MRHNFQENKNISRSQNIAACKARLLGGTSFPGADCEESIVKACIVLVFGTCRWHCIGWRGVVATTHHVSVKLGHRADGIWAKLVTMAGWTVQDLTGVIEVHAREMHAYEMHANEVYAHKVHAHEVHAREMHAREVHAYEVHVP